MKLYIVTQTNCDYKGLEFGVKTGYFTRKKMPLNIYCQSMINIVMKKIQK